MIEVCIFQDYANRYILRQQLQHLKGLKKLSKCQNVERNFFMNIIVINSQLNTFLIYCSSVKAIIC